MLPPVTYLPQAVGDDDSNDQNENAEVDELNPSEYGASPIKVALLPGAKTSSGRARPLVLKKSRSSQGKPPVTRKTKPKSNVEAKNVTLQFTHPEKEKKRREKKSLGLMAVLSPPIAAIAT